jgi:hypothetical protein
MDMGLIHMAALFRRQGRVIGLHHGHRKPLTGPFVLK